MKPFLVLGILAFGTLAVANLNLEEVAQKANNEINDELLKKMIAGGKSSRMNRKKFTAM